MNMSSIILFSLLLLGGCLSADKANELAGQAANANANGGGEANSLGFLVTAVTPPAGSFSGGYDVTISGSQFDTSTTFRIGGTDCTTSTVISASSAVCRVPAGALGLRDVTAVKGAQTNTLASGFQYVGNATVVSHLPVIVPATIPTLLTITGTNFVPGATVNVSHPSLPLLPCQPVTVVNSTTITCYTPTLSAAQSHTVKSSGILSSVLITNPDTTQVSLANSLDLIPAPQYSSMSFAASGVTAPPRDGVLNNGLAAYVLTINGNYFVAGATVQVGGSAAGSCAFVSATVITCTALPSVASEGNYSVAITNADGQSSTSSVLFVNKPTIVSTTPTNIRYTGGDVPVINGTGLGLNPTVEIYNNANTALLGTCPVATSSPLSCTAPVLGSAQTTTMRLRNDYGYRTTYNPLQFITATTLTMTNTEVGRVVQGSSYNHTVTLNNPSLTVAATGITIDTSAIAAPFTYVSTTCGATLAAASSCNIVFTYAPTSLAVHHSGYIDVDYNDGVSAQTLSRRISGWATPLDVLMTSLDYGTIPFGVNHQGAGNEARFTKPIVLINRGKSSVTLNSGAFTTGTEWVRTPLAERFTQAAPHDYECGATLAAGAKCVWALDFQPTSTGVKNDTYTITYNGTYTKAVSLTGTGGSATLTTCNPANTTWNAQGAGTVGSPYLICTEAQFTNLITATQANTGASRTSKYLQVADITFTANLTNPIYATTGFAFEGGGYRLINPVINQSATTDRGLFYGPTSQTGNISFLQAYNLNISGASNTAGILSYDGTVSNSYVYGSVTSSAGLSGGLKSWSVGVSTTVTNSYFLGEVTCGSDNCGGIHGYAANVSQSFSHGRINGANGVGGIIGANASAYTIQNSASSMDVTGTNQIGGIAGLAIGTVRQSHYYGTATGTSAVGGIVGASSSTINIEKSSFKGRVVATSAGGGMWGTLSAWTPVPISISECVSSGQIQVLSNSGGFIGYYNYPASSTYINDSFSLSTLSGSSSAGLSSSNRGLGGGIDDSYNRSYVATPTGGNLFTATAASQYMISLPLVAPSVSTFNGVMYLDGIHTDQVAAGIYDLTDAQMQTQNVWETLGTYDFTVGTGKWKYSGLLPAQGYPWPVLQWMPDDWMP